MRALLRKSVWRIMVTSMPSRDNHIKESANCEVVPVKTMRLRGQAEADSEY